MQLTSVAQIGCRLIILPLCQSPGLLPDPMLAHLFGRDLIDLHSPAMSKTIRQLEDCKNKFSLGSSPFLHTRLQRQILDRSRV